MAAQRGASLSSGFGLRPFEGPVAGGGAVFVVVGAAGGVVTRGVGEGVKLRVDGVGGLVIALGSAAL